MINNFIAALRLKWCGGVAVSQSDSYMLMGKETMSVKNDSISFLALTAAIVYNKKGR